MHTTRKLLGRSCAAATRSWATVPSVTVIAVEPAEVAGAEVLSAARVLLEG